MTIRSGSSYRAVVPVLALVAVVLAGAWSTLAAQTRIAVLPFRNTHGSMEYNVRSYQLADTINAVLTELSKNDPSFTIVPPDSVQDVLSTLNLDPTNPQYESDVWRAVEMLNVDRVVTGTFNIKYNKILINTSVYEVETKLADTKNEARNVYKPYDKTFEAIPTIIKMILPAVAKQ